MDDNETLWKAMAIVELLDGETIDESLTTLMMAIGIVINKGPSTKRRGYQVLTAEHILKCPLDGLEAAVARGNI